MDETARSSGTVAPFLLSLALIAVFSGLTLTVIGLLRHFLDWPPTPPDYYDAPELGSSQWLAIGVLFGGTTTAVLLLVGSAALLVLGLVSAGIPAGLAVAIPKGGSTKTAHHRRVSVWRMIAGNAGAVTGLILSRFVPADSLLASLVLIVGVAAMSGMAGYALGMGWSRNVSGARRVS